VPGCRLQSAVRSNVPVSSSNLRLPWRTRKQGCSFKCSRLLRFATGLTKESALPCGQATVPPVCGCLHKVSSWEGLITTRFSHRNHSSPQLQVFHPSLPNSQPATTSWKLPRKSGFRLQRCRERGGPLLASYKGRSEQVRGQSDPSSTSPYATTPSRTGHPLGSRKFPGQPSGGGHGALPSDEATRQACWGIHGADSKPQGHAGGSEKLEGPRLRQSAVGMRLILEEHKVIGVVLGTKVPPSV